MYQYFYLMPKIYLLQCELCFYLKCLDIFAELRKTLREDISIVKVWLAKRFSTDGDGEDIFVIETDGEKTCEISLFEGKKVIYVDIYSKESEVLERRDVFALRSYSQEQIDEVYQEIAKQQNSIYKQHSNIVSIDVSAFKSSSFGTDLAECSPGLTVVIFCRIKGYIPVGEKEFPEFLGKFRTDIRKDIAFSLSKRPDEYHDHIRMGCSITGEGVPYSLTLGSFFIHPKTGKVCTWTCAHGFLTPDYLKQCGLKNINNYLCGMPVYQPCRLGKRKQNLDTSFPLRFSKEFKKICRGLTGH